MGTIKNGLKWLGASINGVEVSGIVKNNNIIYNKMTEFIFNYIDTLNNSYTERLDSSSSLKSKIQDLQTDLASCSIRSTSKPSFLFVNRLFAQCLNVTDIDLSNLDVSRADDLSYWFYNCSNLINLNLSNFSTSNVTNMSYMFSRCAKIENLDLSSFNTLNVSNMNNMFHYCSSLKTLNLSNFDFTNVTDYTDMLKGIPTDCLITVKDQNAKDFILNIRDDLTNIVIKE